MRHVGIIAGLLIFAAAPSAAQADRRDRYEYAPPFTPAWAPPQLRVRPEVAPPGSEVQISGARFRGDVRVYLGDRPMQIVARGERSLVVVVPRRVRGGDYIYVVDAIGRARTKIPLSVVGYQRPYYDRGYYDRGYYEPGPYRR